MTSVGMMASSAQGLTCTDVLTEPFDSLTAWTTVGGVTIVAGRTGTGAQMTGTSSASYLISAPNESDVVTVGVAYRITALPTQRLFLQLTSDANTSNHLTFQVTTGGAIQAQVGGTGGGVIGTTAAGLIVINTWAYIEVQATLHETAGKVTVRVNGSTVLTLTDVDTRFGGTKTVFDAIKLSNGGAGATGLFDDFYLSTGAACTFKGSQVIGTSTEVLLENFTDTSEWSGLSSVAGGRTGNCGNVSGSGNSVYTFPAPAQSPFVTTGFAFRTSNIAATIRNIFSFRDASNADQITVRTETTGALSLCSSSSTVLATSATGLIVASTWNYIEVQAFVADAASGGYATVRCNGTTVITFVGDTRPGTGTPVSVTNLFLRGPGSAQSSQWDDLYITTGSASAFKGDITVP